MTPAPKSKPKNPKTSVAQIRSGITVTQTTPCPRRTWRWRTGLEAMCQQKKNAGGSIAKKNIRGCCPYNGKNNERKNAGGKIHTRRKDFQYIRIVVRSLLTTLLPQAYQRQTLSDRSASPADNPHRIRVRRLWRGPIAVPLRRRVQEGLVAHLGEPSDRRRH
jgi:hypothetical protein